MLLTDQTDVCFTVGVLKPGFTNYAKYFTDNSNKLDI